MAVYKVIFVVTSIFIYFDNKKDKYIMRMINEINKKK